VATNGRIVVGVDGSESSLDALNWAVDQAELTGALVEVIVTWEWPTGYWSLPYPEGWDPATDARAVVAEPVERLRKTHPKLHIDITVTEGHPAPVLVEASRRADLLVVGSRGHGEFSGMLLGSVSEHCVTNAHCPVLVFRGD
jgi:nucleotide-binding universal stress UspA family protein